MVFTVRARLLSLTLICEEALGGWLIACRSPVGPFRRVRPPWVTIAH
jgi:hypothetical protein